MAPPESLLWWGVLQVTLCCLVGGLLAVVLRKGLQESASYVLLSCVLLNTFLSLLVFLPLPSWWKLPEPEADVAPAVVVPAAMEFDIPVIAFEPPQAPLVPMVPPGPSASSPIKGAEFPKIPWDRAPLLVIGALILLGVLRFFIGLAGVSRQRRRATRLSDPRLREMVAELSRAMKIAEPVELLECHEIATAATIGWRRPAILFPSDWRTWAPDVLRSVVAHELGHIARSHFPAWCLAQFSLSLHFYHPLMHWLVRRLRLEQEYEADALAAKQLTNGSSYLEALAQLALSGTRAPMAWPVRAFLPTESALLKRVSMLRLKNRNSRMTRRAGALFVALVVLCGGLISGIRPATSAPAGEHPQDEQAGELLEQNQEGASNVVDVEMPSGAFTFKWGALTDESGRAILPNDSKTFHFNVGFDGDRNRTQVAAAQNGDVAGSQPPKSGDQSVPGVDKAAIEHGLLVARTVSFNRLKHLGLAFHNYADRHEGRFPPAVIYDDASGVARSWRVEILPYIDQQRLYEQYRKDEPWDSEENLKVLNQMPSIFYTTPFEYESKKTSLVVLTGPQTVFGGKVGMKLSEISDGLSNTILAVDMPPVMLADDNQDGNGKSKPRPMFSVEWTKPVDFEIDLSKNPPNLKQFGQMPFNVTLGNGSVRHFPGTLDVSILKSMITPAGGESVDWSKL